MRGVAGGSTEGLGTAGGRGVARGLAEGLCATGGYVGGSLGDSLTAVSTLQSRTYQSRT